MNSAMPDARRLALEEKRGIWTNRVITDYVDRWIADKPDATALISFRDEDCGTTRLSWRELAQNAAAIARKLKACGVTKGDIVSFQLPNSWQFVAVHLACVRIGAVSNPLMPIFRERELGFMVRHAESKVLIVPSQFRGFDHGALALALQRDLPALKHVFIVGGEGEHSFEQQMLAGADSIAIEPGTPLEPNDVMQLLFTSGTTGESKGVLHTSNTLIGTILQFIKRMDMGAREEVVFMPSPLAHQAGFSYGMTQSLLLGAPLLLTDVWNAANALDLMEKHGATFTFAATPFLADLANFPGVEKRALGAFRLFVSSGAPIPPVLVQLAQEKMQMTVSASWGMTECCSATTTLLSKHKVLESDGCPVPGAEVRVVDGDGKVLPAGEPGALQFRGASLFVGYLKRPQLYTVDQEGWFHTGDVAHIDAEGYIRICGRDKDIIIRGGENIPVVEIESTLYMMDKVAEAAIVAMPCARLSERACAFVTLRPGQSLTLDEMRAHLQAQGVSKNFWPERLEIIEKMPWTATGKIQKYVLREMAKGFSATPTAATVSA